MIEQWTIIVASVDAVGLSSVQCVVSFGEDAESAARQAFDECKWLQGFSLVAAVRGIERVMLRDDARTAEFGLQRAGGV